MIRKNLTAIMLAIMVGLAGFFGIVGSAQASGVGMPVFYPLDKCMSGVWHNSAKDGEGIDLTVLEDSVYGYVYTYHGTSADWYVFAGPKGKNRFNLYKTIKTNDPWKATVHEVGVMSLHILDTNHVTFTMTLQMDLFRDVLFPMCLTNCTTIFEYERLTELPNSPCLFSLP